MYRLIYKSRGTSPINRETVDSIMLQSLQNNLKESLGGILICTNTHFLQVLEGELEKVNEVFMRIARDARHTDVQLIAFSEIGKRLFHQWKMRVIHLSDINDSARTALIDKYGREGDDVLIPSENWMALAMIHDIQQISDLPEWKEA